MQLCAKGGIIVVFGCAGSHMGVEIFPEMIFRSVKYSFPSLVPTCGGRDLPGNAFQVNKVKITFPCAHPWGSNSSWR